MGYFKILMKPNKMLIVTNKINLRQHETMVDKIRFTIPINYSDDINLSDFDVVFEWLDPTNVVHIDTLVKDESYSEEGFMSYLLPVTSPINRYAGDIEGKLVFTYTDYETSTRYKLDTESVIITISTIRDYYAVLPDESFDGISNAISELRAQTDAFIAAAELYDKSKADNHIITEDGELWLTSHGERIGTGVNVAVVEQPDEGDDNEDGVIDISGKYTEVTL